MFSLEKLLISRDVYRVQSVKDISFDGIVTCSTLEHRSFRCAPTVLSSLTVLFSAKKTPSVYLQKINCDVRTHINYKPDETMAVN
jgi:hypothetical protein